MTNFNSDVALNTRIDVSGSLRIFAHRYLPQIWRDHANFDQMTACWLNRLTWFRHPSSKLIAVCKPRLKTFYGRFLLERSQ